jgi:hypothetical protein
MTIWVEEYMAMASAQERLMGVPQMPARAVTQVSSGGAVSTIALDPGTQFVALFNTAANGFLIMGGSSTGSTTTGSTHYVPQNQPIIRGVKPLAKLFVWST